jgi:hypothetical protein
MRTLIPYLQCVAITETKGSFDELVKGNIYNIMTNINTRDRLFDLVVETPIIQTTSLSSTYAYTCKL